MIQQTDRTTPSRYAHQRMHYDEATVFPILDEALFCTVSYSQDKQPFSIPTAFVRIGNTLYIHGSVGSHFLRGIESGVPVCISVMLVDELVVAKSAFHHSANYRSVVIFSKAVKTNDYDTKAQVLKELTEKIVPKSWEYLRPMKDNEVHKTMVLAFEIVEASAKVRTGMPSDDEEDENLPIWSGLIPIPSRRLAPIAQPSDLEIPIPEHLKFS